MSDIDKFPQLTSPSDVVRFLKEENIYPKKSLGQNFLIDRNILNILLDAAELSSSDTVLEIGPGLGVVTESLISKAGKVLAVEKDYVLANLLKKRFKDASSLNIVEQDMLEIFKSGQWTQTPWLSVNKVVSNLPYSVGSRILVDLSMAATPPELMVVTLQREVADRLTASPGSANYGMMSVWIQLKFKVQLIQKVKPTCFWPKPEVQSAILKLSRIPGCEMNDQEMSCFYLLTREGFEHRRKQLITSLSRGKLQLEQELLTETLAKLDINLKARPGELSVEQWCEISQLLAKRVLSA